MINKIRKLLGLKCPLFPKAQIKYLKDMLTERVELCKRGENLEVDEPIHPLNRTAMDEHRAEFKRKREVAEYLLTLLEKNDSNDHYKFMNKLKEM